MLVCDQTNNVDLIEKVKVVPSSRSRFIWRFIFLLLLTASYVFRILNPEKDQSLLKNAQTVLVTAIVITVLLKYWECIHKAENTVELLNGIIKLEAIMPQEYNTQSFQISIKIAKLFADYNQKIIVRALPVVISIGCCIQPNTPFSIIMPYFINFLDCFRILKILVVFGSNWCVWMILCKTRPMISIDLLIGPICLTFYASKICKWALSIISENRVSTR